MRDAFDADYYDNEPIHIAHRSLLLEEIEREEAEAAAALEYADNYGDESKVK